MNFIAGPAVEVPRNPTPPTLESAPLANVAGIFQFINTISAIDDK